MSVVRGRMGTHVPVCDCCGEALDGEVSFDNAVDAKRDNGWKSQKLPDGSWQDLCPECQDKPGDVFRKG